MTNGPASTNIWRFSKREIEPKLKNQAGRAEGRTFSHPWAFLAGRFLVLETNAARRRLFRAGHPGNPSWRSPFFVVARSGLRDALYSGTCCCTAPPGDGCGPMLAVDFAGAMWFVWPVGAYFWKAAEVTRA